MKTDIHLEQKVNLSYQFAWAIRCTDRKNQSAFSNGLTSAKIY